MSIREQGTGPGIARRLRCLAAAASLLLLPLFLLSLLLPIFAAQAAEPVLPAALTEVQDALLPPLRLDMPTLGARALEPRFALAIREAPADQAFAAIVAGSRYSVLLHPEVTGRVTLSLKDTNVREALDALRDLYGYDYRFHGTSIFVQPPGLQTRLFRINYASVDPGRVQRAPRSDFWQDLRQALGSLVGTQAGRSVLVSPQASLVAVKATPAELRDVERYLKEVRLAVERQVLLEARIIEVTLAERFQAGVDWSQFAAGARATSTWIRGVPGGPLLGLASRSSDFSGLMAFLETQGTVQVVSSPRLATLHNRRAVLKVGTDALYVTNVASAGAGGQGAAPLPGALLRPVFSGVSLEVLPLVDEASTVILHVHPSVSEVINEDKTVPPGQSAGSVLPLARSAVSESDSAVRVRDGEIVAIGGLMKLSSGLVKKELVILIKPMVMEPDAASVTWGAAQR